MQKTKRRRSANNKKRNDGISSVQQAYTGDSRNMRASSTRANPQPTLYCGNVPGKNYAAEWRGSFEKTQKTPVHCGLTQLDYLAPQNSGLFDRFPPKPSGKTLMEQLQHLTA